MSFWKPSNLKDAVRWICVISCVLSVLGSLAIIIAYARYPKLRKPARHLLLWLSVADLFTALIYIITIIGCYDCKNCAPGIKLLTAILGIFWPVASFLWTDCIAIYIFGASYQKKWVNPTKRLFFVFHILSWIFPLILVLIIITMYFVNKEDIELTSEYTGGWCWVTKFKTQLIGGKAIEIFSYIFLFIVYFSTYCRLRKIKKFKKRQNNLISNQTDNDQSRRSAVTNFSSNHNKINELLTRLTLIPLIFIILRSFGTLRVLLVYFEAIKQDGIFDNILQIGQAFCDPLQGFCNAVLFLLCVSAVRETIFNIQDNAQRYREILVTTTSQKDNSQQITNDTTNINTVTTFSSQLHDKPGSLI